MKIIKFNFWNSYKFVALAVGAKEELRLCNGIARRENCIPSPERKASLLYAMNFYFIRVLPSRTPVIIEIPSSASFKLQLSVLSLSLSIYVCVCVYASIILDFL